MYIQKCYTNLFMMAVRVDEELKEHMRRHPQVNWSEIAREAIEKKVRELEMREAAAAMDELTEKTSGAWSGEEEIRKWRDRPVGHR